MSLVGHIFPYPSGRGGILFHYHPKLGTCLEKREMHHSLTCSLRSTGGRHEAQKDFNIVKKNFPQKQRILGHWKLNWPPTLTIHAKARNGNFDIFLIYMSKLLFVDRMKWVFNLKGPIWRVLLCSGSYWRSHGCSFELWLEPRVAHSTFWNLRSSVSGKIGDRTVKSLYRH